MKIKHLQAFIASCILLSCGNNATQPAPVAQTPMKENTQIETPTQADVPGDTLKWIDSFRAFRDAVYQRKKEKVKQFIDFPIESREIWYLVGNEKNINIQTDETIPFTEKDFDQYFSKLFYPAFINSLLKVKTEELYNKGEHQTAAIKDGASSNILYCTIDKTDNTLTLNFNSETKASLGNGEYETTESSIIYIFAILPDGKIKLKNLLMAG